MKNVLFFLAISLSVGAYSQSASTFDLSGEFSGQAPAKIYLAFTNSKGVWIRDSLPVEKNRFVYQASIDQVSLATLSTYPNAYSQDARAVTVYFEPGKQSIRLNASNFQDYQLTGSKSDIENREMQKRLAPVYKKIEPISKKYEAKNQEFISMRKKGATEHQLDSLKAILEEIRNSMDPFREEIVKIQLDFFHQYPQSFVTAHELRFHVSDMSADTLLSYLNRMSPTVRNSADGKLLEKEYAKLKAGSPGSIAKDFAAKTITGDNIKLSDFKGKYVLLDFWASWCVPCRKGNPHLKELYTRYKDKGIEFIGVSDDDSNPDAWKKAVDKDGLPWLHVLRGLDWDKIRKGEDNPNDISELFGIHSLPTKILIDRDGKIIGRFGEEEGPLDQLLTSLFGKS